jgi:translation initiation factor 5
MASKKNEGKVTIPRGIQDPHFRYWMPVLQAKIEGRGNGIKTVITNMADIAKCLDRPPSYPTKYFGFELGAQTKIEKDRYVVNGSHSAESLATLLDGFIEKFVLCKQDQNPETVIKITPKGEVDLVCKACGTVTRTDLAHKLTSFIVKNPPTQDKKKDEPAKTKAQRRAEKKNGENGDENGDSGDDKTEENGVEVKASPKEEEADDVQWSTDTSKEAVERRRRELLGDGTTQLASLVQNDLNISEKPVEEKPKTKDAADELADIVTKIDKTNAKASMAKAKAIQEREGWSDRTFVQGVFFSLFDKNIVEQLKTRASILAKFITDEMRQKIVMLCIEKLCVGEPTVLTKLPTVLNALYDAEILEEEILLKWNDHPNKKFDPEASAKIRKAAQPFIEWLKNADSDSE